MQLSVLPRPSISAPVGSRRADVRTFNSGGSGARPALDGLNPTAFSSGVMTMPAEAKERAGLGQYIKVGARAGYASDLSAILDPVHHPAAIAQDDGTAMQGKNKQFVAPGQRVMMAFPSVADYGDVALRDAAAVKRDLARGYISAQAAADAYGLDPSEIAAVQAAAAQGEDI